MLYKVSKVHNEATPLQENNEININLTISSPISGVMLMLLLLSLRASEVDAPSDLQQYLKVGCMSSKIN